MLSVMCYTVFGPISAISTCVLSHSVTKSTAESYKPGQHWSAEPHYALNVDKLSQQTKEPLQYASSLVSFTFEVFLFAQRPERQVGSDMVDHCVQTALKLTHQRDRHRDRGRGEARRGRKKKKSQLTCRVAGRVVPTPGCL